MLMLPTPSCHDLLTLPLPLLVLPHPLLLLPPPSSAATDLHAPAHISNPAATASPLPHSMQLPPLLLLPSPAVIAPEPAATSSHIPAFTVHLHPPPKTK